MTTSVPGDTVAAEATETPSTKSFVLSVISVGLYTISFCGRELTFVAKRHQKTSAKKKTMIQSIFFSKKCGLVKWQI